MLPVLQGLWPCANDCCTPQLALCCQIVNASQTCGQHYFLLHSFFFTSLLVAVQLLGHAISG